MDGPKSVFEDDSLRRQDVFTVRNYRLLVGDKRYQVELWIARPVQTRNNGLRTDYLVECSNGFSWKGHSNGWDAYDSLIFAMEMAQASLARCEREAGGTLTYNGKPVFARALALSDE